jgi:hypothetical protein
MQKWRSWEAAGEADWLLVKRESVIAPLAAQFFRPGLKYINRFEFRDLGVGEQRNRKLA